MSKKNNIHYYFGVIGEYAAMFLYFMKFYQNLEHRFKTKVGEIDLICKRFNTLVFVEVKSRSRNYDDLLCSKKQQQRIGQAAKLFLLQNPQYQNYKLRFDLVLIRPFALPLTLKNFITN
jgi:putative endonuclease